MSTEQPNLLHAAERRARAEAEAGAKPKELVHHAPAAKQTHQLSCGKRNRADTEYYKKFLKLLIHPGGGGCWLRYCMRVHAYYGT